MLCRRPSARKASVCFKRSAYQILWKCHSGRRFPSLFSCIQQSVTPWAPLRTDRQRWAIPVRTTQSIETTKTHTEFLSSDRECDVVRRGLWRQAFHTIPVLPFTIHINIASLMDSVWSCLLEEQWGQTVKADFTHRTDILLLYIHRLKYITFM